MLKLNGSFAIARIPSDLCFEFIAGMIVAEEELNYFFCKLDDVGNLAAPIWINKDFCTKCSMPQAMKDTFSKLRWGFYSPSFAAEQGADAFYDVYGNAVVCTHVDGNVNAAKHVKEDIGRDDLIPLGRVCTMISVENVHGLKASYSPEECEEINSKLENEAIIPAESMLALMSKRLSEAFGQPVAFDDGSFKFPIIPTLRFVDMQPEETSDKFVRPYTETASSSTSASEMTRKEFFAELSKSATELQKLTKEMIKEDEQRTNDGGQTDCPCSKS